jgi:hypothetical protein
VEFRTPHSASDTLTRLREAFPLLDLWTLARKPPWALSTNVGAFDGDTVHLRVINRPWQIHPELYAQVRASTDGSTLVGVIRNDKRKKALYVLLFSVFSALAGAVTWSHSSSLRTTIFATPAIALAFHTTMAFLLSIEADHLRRDVQNAIRSKDGAG